ncbi:MAG: DUF1311 domain-containing protein [Beijerinckiaceae bacterium]|nr:DUF1311 domain-containing protein [Beijerinckiaceae bacterium]
MIQGQYIVTVNSDILRAHFKGKPSAFRQPYTAEEEISLSEIITAFNERHGTKFTMEDFLRFEQVTLDRSPGIPGGVLRLQSNDCYMARRSTESGKYVQRIFLLPIIPSLAVLTLPATAEMFGPDYPPCGDQPNTVAIVDCIEAKTRVWDERLNKAYKELPQRIHAGQIGPLKDAQRLWIKFRDANCGFYGSQEGTIRQIQAAECMRSMTQDRALELENAMKFD